MTHRACEELFVQALYNEIAPADREAFEGHLRECSQCHKAFVQVLSIATVMKQRTRPELSQTEWTIAWNELETQIQSTKRPAREFRPFQWITEVLRFRPMVRLGIAGLSLVVVGMFIGRLISVDPDVTAQRLADQLSETQKALLNERAQNYLQRSKILLLGIVNGANVTPSSYSITKQQVISRMLVSEAGGLQSQLTEADQQRMRKLITDLEVILLQIANLGESKDFPGMQIVREGVERNGLLLKINLEQMHAQERRDVPKNSNRSQSSSI